MKQYKIFEGTIQSALDELLKEGYLPANIKTVWEYKNAGKIPKQWYDTRSYFHKGEIKDIPLKDLKDIEAFYKNGNSVLFLGDSNENLLDAYGNFDNDGR